MKNCNFEKNFFFCQCVENAEKLDEELPASGSSTDIAGGPISHPACRSLSRMSGDSLTAMHAPPWPGIWKLAYDQDGKVQHIFCLRQLTREEKKYRLKLRPNQTYVDFSAGSLLGPELELTPEQVARMADAASRFNEVRGGALWKRSRRKLDGLCVLAGLD